MNIHVHIPDSILPDFIVDALYRGDLEKVQTNRLLRILLLIAADQIDECTITEGEL